MLIYAQLEVHLNPLVLFCRAAFLLSVSLYVLAPEHVLPQLQDFVLRLALCLALPWRAAGSADYPLHLLFFKI